MFHLNMMDETGYWLYQGLFRTMEEAKAKADEIIAGWAHNDHVDMGWHNEQYNTMAFYVTDNSTTETYMVFIITPDYT